MTRIHMGEMVEQAFREYQKTHSGCTADSFAAQICCERRNLYDIFHRQSIDIQLLMQICVALEYNLFEDIAGIIRQELEQQHRGQASPSRLTHFLTTRSYPGIAHDAVIFVLSPTMAASGTLFAIAIMPGLRRKPTRKSVSSGKISPVCKNPAHFHSEFLNRAM